MRVLCRVRIVFLLLTSASGFLIGSGIARGELVGWWKLDDGSGMTAHDSSGNEHHGTLHGDPQWVRGVTGSALEFDGKDDYVYMGSVGIGWADPRTIVGWAKASTTDIQGGTSVFGFGGEGNSITRYWDLEVTDAGYYAGYVGGAFSESLIPLDTEWHHFASSLGSSVVGGNEACAYVDGESFGCVGGGSYLSTVDEVRIGGRLTNDHYFPGIVDDFRVYDEALTLAEVRAIMGVPEASDPIPADGTQLPGTDVELSWSPGNFIASHDVYLGDNFNAVNERADETFVGNQTDTSLVVGLPGSPYPDGLALGAIYYWCVDEVEADGMTKHRGEVWTFKAELFAFPIENIVATTNAISEANARIENTINGSGLNIRDQHSTESVDMWLGTANGTDPIQLQYDFGRLYKLHQMVVWNYNVMFEAVLGFGLKDVTVEYSVDGAEWTVLDDVEFAQATARADYAPNTTVNFGGVLAQHIRLTVNGGYGTMGKFGLSEVRFLYLPVQARAPQPDDSETGVAVETVLTWRAGREAALHEVYISTDEGAVADGTALVDIVSDTSYITGGFDLDTTYYWKVNEVNEAETISVWEGTIWRFSTQEYLVVDDFESYEDEDNRIYDAWLDGAVNSTGSTVGYAVAPFAEQSIVHSGLQSMPLAYDNANLPCYSEASRTWNTAQNWADHGADTLRLCFRGEADNTPDQLYLRVEDNAGHATTVIHPDIDAVLTTEWTSWPVSLDEFSSAGIDVESIKTLYLGVGDRNDPSPTGSGTVYIDDIEIGHPPSSR